MYATSSLGRFVSRSVATSRALGLMFLCICALPGLVGSRAFAATITVDTVVDEDNGNTVAANGPLGNHCSLREALQAVFNNDGQPYKGCSGATMGGPNTINISVGGTITINSLVPDPTIAPPATGTTRNGNMSDIGDAATRGKLTITNSGGAIIGCDAQPNGVRILHVESGGDLTLTGLTIQDCTAGGSGVAILDESLSNLTLNTVTFSNIKSDSGGPGGAVAHGSGTLTVNNANFLNCTSDDGNGHGDGGALSLGSVELPQTVLLNNVTWTSNTAGGNGGAISWAGADSLGHAVQMTNNLFTLNKANGSSDDTPESGGGAIYAKTSSSTPLAALWLIGNTQFINNSAPNGVGGAISIPSGQLAYPAPETPLLGGIFASNFLNNSAGGNASADLRGGAGGAIYARTDFLTVVQSAFVNNSSSHGSGGAIANFSPSPTQPSVIANVTFSGNSADQDGGAIANLHDGGKITLINDTISGNSAAGTGNEPGGGAIFNADTNPGNVTASNTIFANSTGMGGNCAVSASGVPIQNVVGNLQSAPDTGCGAMAFGNPQLSSPSVSPGPNVFVLTMSLNEGSAASNAGDNTTCNGAPVLTFDATGRPGIRPSPGGSKCDIGAYESGNAPVYASVPAPGATINLAALTNGTATGTVVISNTGSDDLIISNYSITSGASQITVNGAATPFTIPVGSSTQTLNLNCDTSSAGNFSATLTVTHNAAGNPATYTVNCAITNPAMPLAITTASPLPNATVSSTYNQTFAATGGTPPYTNWAITAGALPSWATLDPTTGALTGTPTNTAGSPFTFTVQVTDSAAGTTTKPFVLTVVAPPLSITTASPLPQAMVGTAYSQTFAAAGGVPPYVNWAVTAGTKPAWATLDPTAGTLIGTPPDISGSPFTFTVQVTDSEAVTMIKQFTLGVTPPPLSITTTSPLMQAVVGTAYTQTFAAIGGTPPYTNWAITAGTPPPWATLAAATGIFTGTAPNTVGSPFTFTVTVTDSAAVTSSKVFILQVIPPPVVITTTSPLPQATVATPYNQTFAASGGVPPYVNWAVIAGTLPAWATLNASTGALTGTPPNTIGSPFTFTIEVTDSSAVTASKVFMLQVNPPGLVITTASPLPQATMGTAYNQTFAASGGTPPYVNWAVTAGTLPVWATLNAATGALTGTPPDTAGTPFTFTIQVTDTAAATTTKVFVLDVTGTTPVTLQDFGVD